ncbi:N-acetyltransferase [Desulfovibrio sp. Huiquan2017]|uniref:GNAT family N-acetyltransferase n=1 Tax=Desulfovibrio sp. Huiquan2017 TaxID=2816861 RepID=UPI001A91CE9A|nr:N-acetyltransferase [Desulfovibrio sp. Huiquan2017]
MTIRLETDNDIAAIRALEYTAFRHHPQHAPGAEPTEHLIVDALRDSGHLSLSLVAEERNRVVGHLALSPAVPGKGGQGWYLLGPVGVLPERQGAGIGSALVRKALRIMRDRGAHGVLLVGDPAFYERFGFRSRPGLTMGGVPQENVLGISLDGTEPEGAVVSDPAFFVTAGE